MKKVINKFCEYLLLEKKVLKENKELVTAQNFFTLQVILLGAIAIFIANFLFSVLSSPVSVIGYGQLSIAYLIVASMAFSIFIAIKIFPKMNCQIAIYTTYTIAIAYCATTSGFVSPNYVSVTILAILFQIPVLFLDKSLRINLFMIFGTFFYLLVIFFFKNKALFIDEVINALSFSTLAMTIGTFVRQAKIENIFVKEELKHLAYYDSLTGIFNRRKLFEDLQSNQEVKGNITGVGMIDVDYFKKYNDTYGHQKGDECLKAIVRCLLSFQARNKISVYRYGGEEFIVLFKEPSKELICNISYGIRMRIESMNREHSSSEFEKVTISMGISFIDESNMEGYESIISKADIALYAAKSNGRNRIATYNDSLNSVTL